jgi:hypothetical protein
MISIKRRGSVTGCTRRSQSLCLNLLSGGNMPKVFPRRGLSGRCQGGCDGNPPTGDCGFSMGEAGEGGPSCEYAVKAGNEGGSFSLACFNDDLRRIVRSAISGSLLIFTTRWDMLRMMVPARCSGDSTPPGESDLFLCRPTPASMFPKSSPVLDTGVCASGVRNRTL